MSSSTQLSWLLDTGVRREELPASDLMLANDENIEMSFLRIDVDAGLRVFLVDGVVRQTTTLEPRDAETVPWISANVALSGACDVATTDGSTVPMIPGTGVVMGLMERRARYAMHPSPRLRNFGCTARCDRLIAILDGVVPKALVPWVEGRPDGVLLLNWRTRREAHAAAASLFRVPLTGALHRLYVEAVSTQILVLMADDLMKSPEAPATALRRWERERVLEAREILLADMRSPPTIAALATAVGIGEKRLNAGFRSLFGGTVYEVFRNERLSHVRKVIETTDLPIKEIAWRVGYTHVNNLTAAFTARFGIAPAYHRKITRGGMKLASAQPD